jgi:hypothetical protein
LDDAAGDMTGRKIKTFPVPVVAGKRLVQLYWHDAPKPVFTMKQL